MTRAEIEQDIWNKGTLDRTHLFNFLKLIPTSDGQDIKAAVNAWLSRLHKDPHFSKISFHQTTIDRVLSDLESYGHVTHETVIDAKSSIMERHRG